MTQRTPITAQGVAPNPAISPGIRAGEFLFISGNVANDSSGRLVGAGDCEAQTRQVCSRGEREISATSMTEFDSRIRLMWTYATAVTA